MPELVTKLMKAPKNARESKPWATNLVVSYSQLDILLHILLPTIVMIFIQDESVHPKAML